MKLVSRNGWNLVTQFNSATYVPIVVSFHVSAVLCTVNVPCVSCCVVFYRVVLCCVVSCRVVLCCVVLCCVVLCCVALCCVGITMFMVDMSPCGLVITVGIEPPSRLVCPNGSPV